MIARRLAYASLTALALAVMVFWFATRTVAGQEFGDDALYKKNSHYIYSFTGTTQIKKCNPVTTKDPILMNFAKMK